MPNASRSDIGNSAESKTETASPVCNRASGCVSTIELPSIWLATGIGHGPVATAVGRNRLYPGLAFLCVSASDQRTRQQCEKSRTLSLTCPSDANNFALMKKKLGQPAELSRRERQIMDIVYSAEEASAADVLEAMADAPGYSTVRKLLGILIEKGHLKHRPQDGKYFYRPTKPRGKAGRSAMTRVLETFYEGSLEKAVAAMLQGRDAKVTDEELARLRQLIDDTQQEERS